MSKIIDEGIKNILEKDIQAEDKINELIELKYSSTDTRKIVSSIKDIFASDFDVELADNDIESEISKIAFCNEGILSIHDEKTLEVINKDRDKLLGEFKEKVELFNIKGVENTTKIVEQISNLEKNNKIIEQEAKNLVDAFTYTAAESILDVKYSAFFMFSVTMASLCFVECSLMCSTASKTSFTTLTERI